MYRARTMDHGVTDLDLGTELNRPFWGVHDNRETNDTVAASAMWGENAVTCCCENMTWLVGWAAGFFLPQVKAICLWLNRSARLGDLQHAFILSTIVGGGVTDHMHESYFGSPGRPRPHPALVLPTRSTNPAFPCHKVCQLSSI